MKNFCLRLSSLLPILLLSFVGLIHPSKTLASDCNAPSIPHNVSAVGGPNAGEVTLYWDQSPFADRYAVAYGTQSGNYIYGADNIGGEPSRSYTVSYLNPGQTYHFVLSAASGACASGFSTEVWATAMSGVGPQMSSMSDSSLWATPGTNPSEVTLKWTSQNGADNYHLVYGNTSKVDQYGALNIGNTTWFKVDKLDAGKSYYFSIIPVQNGQAMKALGPVMVRHIVEQSGIAQSQEALMQPIVRPNPVVTMPTIVPTRIPTVYPTLYPTSIPKVSPASGEPSYFIP